LTKALVKYHEPLEPGELLFLERKAGRERANYRKVYWILLFFCLLFPFAGAWYREYEGAPTAFSPLKFFATALVLVSICSLSVYAAYRRFLRNILLDIRDKTKTVEISHVTKKLFVSSRDTYYLYTDSQVKMSIEVSHESYLLMEVGDELCIEYSTHAGEYLGYY